MTHDSKHKLANELYYIGVRLLIGVIAFFIYNLIFGGGQDFSDQLDTAFIWGLILVGLGYAYRLIKWVLKWKD